MCMWVCVGVYCCVGYCCVYLADRARAEIEHVTLVGSAGGPRPREGLVEGSGVPECARHVGYVADIPARQIGVKGGGVGEYAAHVGYVADIPAR